MIVIGQLHSMIWITWLLGSTEIKSRIIYIWTRNVGQIYTKKISFFKSTDDEKCAGIIAAHNSTGTLCHAISVEASENFVCVITDR